MIDKLSLRLRSAANYARRSDDGQCALLSIQVFKVDAHLIGWTKPAIHIIEPRLFNYSSLDYQPVTDWDEVARLLDGHRLLLIKSGEPVGFIK